jgi:hypothetical protein
MHYSNVLVLYYVFLTLSAESSRVTEVPSRLNIVSIKLINDKESLRSARVPGDYRLVYLTAI